MGEMTSGTGEVYKDPGPDDPEPVMTTGDGVVLSGPDAGTGSTPEAADSGDLDEMSKSELYEQAKEADIEGRSGMSKEELKEALEEQG